MASGRSLSRARIKAAPTAVSATPSGSDLGIGTITAQRRDLPNQATKHSCGRRWDCLARRSAPCAQSVT
jgi:hypothetical protein